MELLASEDTDPFKEKLQIKKIIDDYYRDRDYLLCPHCGVMFDFLIKVFIVLNM